MRVCFIFLFLCPSAIAPDFSQNLLKAQTLTRQGGDVLIECKPRMSPRGIISWRKGKEALRENHRYTEQHARVCVCVCLFSPFRVYFINLWFYVSLLGIHGLQEPSRSVTPRHLNCITRSARRHSAGYVSSLDCTIVFCSRGSARSHFLQCLPKVIGRWRRAVLGSMDWSISSLVACRTWKVIRGRGKKIQATTETRRKQPGIC